MSKPKEFYRALPYMRRVRLETEESGEVYYVAYIEELEGVQSDGDTPWEALANLRDAFEDYLSAMFEWGAEIPVPEALEIGEPTPSPGSVVIASFAEVPVGLSPVTTEWIDMEEEVSMVDNVLTGAA
ncbi:MAG: type II toxin-antitoxin system HicB family antitoxin [Gemmatimonadota bacterium]